MNGISYLLFLEIVARLGVKKIIVTFGENHWASLQTKVTNKILQNFQNSFLAFREQIIWKDFDKIVYPLHGAAPQKL